MFSLIYSSFWYSQISFWLCFKNTRVGEFEYIEILKQKYAPDGQDFLVCIEARK